MASSSGATTAHAVRCLTAVVPCFNEQATIGELISRVLASPYIAEIIVVDDGSTDDTADIVRNISDSRVRLFEQPVNMGKGAALRRGFQEATAQFVVVQDADLEYDPNDYEQLLMPLLAGEADVVYGSRFRGARAHRVLYYWHSVGNRFLTTVSNMFTNLNLTDMETCYKVFRREVIQSIEIEEDRFGFEPEITAKIARAGYRVFEVGISYSGRTYSEGKKIGWRDGVHAVYSIVRYSSLVPRGAAPDGPADFAESEVELAGVLDSLQDADNYAEWIYTLCEPHLGSDVLEVGAGVGELTERFSHGRFVTATDLSKRCVEQLEERFRGFSNVDVEHADIASMLAKPRRFDSVVLVNVLEHIEDDYGALCDIARLLKPGGRVIVFSPAFQGLYGEFDHKVGHYRRYRRSQLITVVDRAGLRLVEARYVNVVGAFIWWLFIRRLGQTRPPGWPIRVWDRFAVPLLQQLEAGRDPAIGQSVLLVAERRD